MTYRYRGHSVSDPAKYRTKEELETYKEKDPISTLVNHVIDKNIATQKEIEKIKVAIDKEIENAMEYADQSDYPLGSELYDDNYVQQDYPFIID